MDETRLILNDLQKRGLPRNVDIFVGMGKKRFLKVIQEKM